LVEAAATPEHSSHLVVVHGSMSDPRFLRWLFLTHLIDDVIHMVVESVDSGGESGAVEPASFAQFNRRTLLVQLAYLMHEAVLAKARSLIVLRLWPTERVVADALSDGNAIVDWLAKCHQAAPGVTRPPRHRLPRRLGKIVAVPSGLQFADSRLSSLLIDASGVVDADDARPPKWLELAARLSREVRLSCPGASPSEPLGRAHARAYIARACKRACKRACVCVCVCVCV
jgi:hypothetical protein